MAGAACKVVINHGLDAFRQSLEQILITKELHQDRVPDAERRKLIQQMADCDIAMYGGEYEMPKGGVGGVAIALEHYGLLSQDVWKVYARPDFTYDELFVSA